MSGLVLMIQGTASSVGKSLMTAALCRIYARRGLRVAPFKSQNMSLNAAVTAQGHEIGRAQAVQAEAAMCAPSVHMNPILLKPEGGNRCQVIVNGEPLGRMSAQDYHAYKPRLADIIADSLNALRAANDLVIIEGAGSPVEMNLKDRDVANMFVAELADAPVLLVGDIDRGGIFASLIGTMTLLEGSERARVKGFLINKFRGDPALLGNGLQIIEERTGVPVLGVVPYLPELSIADEDSTSLPARELRFARKSMDTGPTLSIAVVRLPHISNYDDFLPLELEAGVALQFVQDAASLATADLVILPGTKCTAADLAWLRARGMESTLKLRQQAGLPILGICGGCQMLGQSIEDPDGVESDARQVDGLSLLPVHTRFRAEKITAQVDARSTGDHMLLAGDGLARGYEIHMGELHRVKGARPAFRIQRAGRSEILEDGAVNGEGTVLGTMLHGIFDNDAVRAALLGYLRGADTPSSYAMHELRASEYDRLAEHLRSCLDMRALDAIIGWNQEVRE